MAHLLEPLIEGFYSLVPREALQVLNLNGATLRLAVCGSLEVDVAGAVRAAAKYSGSASADSPSVRWMWEVLGEQPPGVRHALWVFVSGTDGLPAGGAECAPLKVIGVPRVVAPGSSKPQLLHAHTCFICVELPEYETREETKVALLASLAFGMDFGQLA